MRILIVDDEAPIRDICERAFRQAGYDCSAAESGEAAVPRLSEGWDIILTDLTMPGAVNGTELLRRARAAGTADVILMTAYPELHTAIESIQGGAYDYLIKPFTVGNLMSTVKRCADKRRLSRELALEKSLRAELQTAHAELTQLNRVKDAFGQFATPEVVQLALSRPEDFWKRGERRTVTVVFADVRGFTAFSSRVPPEEAVATLNAIFSRALDAIDSEGGILNKFLGDGIMAIFGAPAPLPYHAAAAARAALKACQEFEALAQARRKQGKEPLEVCLGINTGEVIAGCLGTRKRTEYSVIGHVVNVASRLEGANKFFGSRIMAGEETYMAARGAVEARELGRVRPAGNDSPIRVFEFLAQKGRLCEGWNHGLPFYERGLASFNKREYVKAAAAFQRVLDIIPNDGPSALYLDCAKVYGAVPPPEDWDGVFNLTAK